MAFGGASSYKGTPRGFLYNLFQQSKIFSLSVNVNFKTIVSYYLLAKFRLYMFMFCLQKVYAGGGG